MSLNEGHPLAAILLLTLPDIPTIERPLMEAMTDNQALHITVKDRHPLIVRPITTPIMALSLLISSTRQDQRTQTLEPPQEVEANGQRPLPQYKKTTMPRPFELGKLWTTSRKTMTTRVG